MPFDFPASPSEGATYTPAGGPTYVFNSPKWVVQGTASSSSSPTGPAGGALAGTYPNPGLAVPYPTTLPPNGVAGGALTGSYPNPTLVGGPLSNYALASSIPTTLPPSGVAGGDLSGTYPNPTAIKASGAFAVTGALTGTTARMGYGTGVPITTSGTVVTPAVQVASTAIDGYSALRYGGGNGATLTFAKSGSTTLGTQALVSSGTSAGKISFNGSNGTNFIEAAYIEGAIDSAGTPGVASMPGRVSIAVSPDGSATPAEALRIDSFKSVFLYGQLNGTTATFTSGAPGAKVLAVTGTTTSAAQDYFDVKLLDATGGGGSAMRVLGGPTGINPLYQVDRAGDTQVAGWHRALSLSPLVTNGADYFGYMLGNGAGGNIGMFAGSGDPHFSTFGAKGAIYLDALGAIPWYNVDGGTTWAKVGTGSGGASLTISDTPPGSPTAGAMWWNSVLGTLMVYYNDGNSSQWVPATPTGPLLGTTATFTSPDNLSTTNIVTVLPNNGSLGVGIWYNGIRAIAAGSDLHLGGNGAGNVRMDTEVVPNTDNTLSLGLPSARWSVVYAGTGAINTSGADEKIEISQPSEAEQRAAARIRAIGPKRYKFKDAVAAKGDKARWHIGYVAEDVRDALAAEGLDPWSYGLLCADEVEGYTRLGLRYAELQSFLMAVPL